MRHLVRGVLALSLLFGTARWANAACDLTQAAVDLTNRSLELFGLAATVEVGDARCVNSKT